MVSEAELRIDERTMTQIIQPMARFEVLESPVDYFAAMAWSVICEPGDSFAGKLIDAFGVSQALSLELAGTSAKDYIARFDEAGVDLGALQSHGRFDKTMAEARERWQPRMSVAAVSKASTEMELRGGWFMTPQSELWPESLGSLEAHAPRGLWVRGGMEAVRSMGQAVSMVGSRMATSYGEFATGEIVGALVNRGYCLVSGGAYGIDAMAHRSTLAMGGFTVAVMAGGLDRLYPSGHAELFKQIEQSGALVSEMPPGAEPTKWRFLQRNRLIAALGQAVIVVEANPRSGAVSTANRALEIGRPLGAVPGPINSAGSDGCHRLIREHKAELVCCGDDVLELLGYSRADEPITQGLGALETRVLDVIGFGVASHLHICETAGLTRDEANLGLSALSLLGVIEQNAHGWTRSSGVRAN